MGLGLGLGLGLGKARRFTPASLFANGEQGAWLPTDIAHLWKDTAGTSAVTANDDTIARIDDQSGRGNNETQATGTKSPKFKTATVSRKYDGTDDVLVGTAVCAASGNTLAAKVTIPASVAALQLISGVVGATVTDRFYLGVNTTGKLVGGVGSIGPGGAIGTTDIRGLTGSVMLIEDGTRMYLYWNGIQEFTSLLSGGPNTALALFEGAINNNGTASNFYSGEVFDLVSIQRAITATERAKLVTYWS